MTRPFFIDTDTASDDAVALIIALTHPEIEVVGIGVVAGNVPLDMAVQNALYTRDQCGSRVAVHPGASGPIKRPLETGQHVHGHDGMGDLGLELTGRTPDRIGAVDALIAAADAYPGELEVVTLGPLSNIALALQRDPSLAERIRRTVIMGAVADHIGNQNPVAEFNMWVDPESVEVVLNSGLAIELVGWDISRHYSVIEPADADRLRALDTPLARFGIDIQRCVSDFCATETKLSGFDLPDPIAMCYAIDPAIATETRHLNCRVETRSELTRGMVVMDLLGFTGLEPNAVVVTAADRQLFMAMLERALDTAPSDPAGAM